MEKVLFSIVKLGETEQFNGELDYGGEISSDEIFEAMRQVGMEESSEKVIEKFLNEAPVIYQTLLAMTFSNYLAASSDPDALKKARRSIRLLLNICQRSPKFAAKIPSESVELLETLLATSQFDTEVLLLLVKTADGSWLEFQKSKRYSNLLERVAEYSGDQMPSALAYLSILLEKDYGFLSNCYAEISPHAFTALLDLVKSLLESKSLRIHSNNLLFVLNLLELMVVDYAAFLTAKVKKEPQSVGERRKATVCMLNFLVEIVGDLCTNIEMTSYLNEKATAICCCIDVLDAVLHAEANFSDYRESHGQEWPNLPPDVPELTVIRKKIEEERRYQRRAQDRPKQPPLSKIQRIETSESLSELADAILEAYQNVESGDYHRMGELKLNCVKAIANLCSLSAFNKLATVQNGRMGLLSVLQCTTRRPEYFMESYTMRNWAIFCTRQLTDECQENKEVILNLSQPAQPIIDRKRLLEEFGIDEQNLQGATVPEMNFGEMENQVYGANLEEDSELLAELAAIQEEEEMSRNRRAAPPPAGRTAPAAARRAQPPAAAPGVPGIDPRALAAALADDHGDGDDDNLENDDDLLNELHGLVGAESPPPPPPQRAQPAPPPVPARSAPTVPVQSSSGPAPSGPPPTLGTDNSQLEQMRQLYAVYHKMYKAAEQGGESAKARRYKRAVDKLTELIGAVQKGKKIDASEIPVAPPNFSFEPSAPAAPVAQSAAHSSAPQIREAAHTSPPAVPERKASAKEPADPKKAAIYRVLQHRRNLYVANGKSAIAAGDKEAAKESVGMAKAFDQAIAALDQCTADEMDLNEVPPSPPPYRKASVPTPAPPKSDPAPPQPAPAPKPTGPLSFVDALHQRQQRYLQMAQKAKTDGNERKERMNTRLAGQYAEAIRDARAGRPVNVAELPTLPDMPSLPPQGGGGGNQKTSPAAAAPHLHQRPAPAQVGPLAPTGVEGKSRNSSQLEFLLERQAQFKQAAIHAKNHGNIEEAKKYLVDAKGFDKMIQAAQAGLPISIKQTPIPPQLTTSQVKLEPRIQPVASSSSSPSSSSALENRGERLALLEKTLIEQVRSAESNQMRFTRLGDVGKVRLFEAWGKTAKQDLLLVREVAKQGLNIPKFHYELRHIPSADLFPDLAEDVIELTISSCRDVPLPSGYEVHHANIFVRYTFPPVVSDQPQTGKTKTVTNTTSPQFAESIILNIGSGKSRNSKLQRVFKRGGLKFEVYQKGGFMRSDKLLGTCEWKLEKLEQSAELEESLPLKEGRKAVGGLLSAKIRIREPIGDAKAQSIAQKWLILDS
uniref:C2 domain-containing protein n=1 Tax=Caenorhabditis japonica TaxID=281687 RepID=A0A8R1DTD3_CAEJA